MNTKKHSPVHAGDIGGNGPGCDGEALATGQRGSKYWWWIQREDGAEGSLKMKNDELCAMRRSMAGQCKTQTKKPN